MDFIFSNKTRTKILGGMIKEWLGVQSKILDVGTGNGDIASFFQSEGHLITPMDIVNKSKHQNIKPIVYDGKHFPFPNNSFDTVLLLTVLHHTPNPDLIINEARRVAKRIIIMEDIYDNFFEKFISKFGCSLVNFEFGGHPHSNRTDKEWKRVFEKLKLKTLAAKYSRQFFSFLYFHHAVYCLERA